MMIDVIYEQPQTRIRLLNDIRKERVSMQLIWFYFFILKLFTFDVFPMYEKHFGFYRKINFLIFIFRKSKLNLHEKFLMPLGDILKAILLFMRYFCNSSSHTFLTAKFELLYWIILYFIGFNIDNWSLFILG